jgi:predicted ArsR family transcriptional regulator
MAADGILARKILELLDEHESLGYADVAERVGEPPDAVRDALTRLRGIGFVDAVSVGELEAHVTRPVTYWRLTHAGRDELARLRRGGRER